MNGVFFDSHSEALDAAVQRLAKTSDLPVNALKMFGESMEVIEEMPQGVGEGLPRQLHPALVGRFAIRNDQLLNLETFLSLLKNAGKLAVGVAEITTLSGVAAVADALHGLYKFYRDIVAKGFVLSEDQLAVVATLRDLQVATTGEIVKCIHARISADVVDEILTSFSRGREPRRGFISKDQTGHWQIDGL